MWHLIHSTSSFSSTTTITAFSSSSLTSSTHPCRLFASSCYLSSSQHSSSSFCWISVLSIICHLISWVWSWQNTEAIWNFSLQAIFSRKSKENLKHYCGYHIISIEQLTYSWYFLRHCAHPHNKTKFGFLQ